MLPKLESVENVTILQVNQLCPTCTLTSNHFTSSGFHCFPASPQAVTFRARLHATQTASSSTLLNLISSWTKQGGVLLESGFQASVDGSCSLEVSSLDAEECMEGVVTTPPLAGGVPGVPAVVVISVSAVVGCLLVLLVALLVSVLIWSACRRRHASITMETKDE